MEDQITETITPQQVRRALARAERGAALDAAEATALLAARGEQLDALCAVAARVRDAGLVAAGRPLWRAAERVPTARDRAARAMPRLDRGWTMAPGRRTKVVVDMSPGNSSRTVLLVTVAVAVVIIVVLLVLYGGGGGSGGGNGY